MNLATVPLQHVPLRPADTEALVAFLTASRWPFHSRPVLDPAVVRDRAAEGHYAGDDVRTFWVLADGDRVGLVRVWDLGDPTPLFDLRVAEAHRGQGVGTATVTWLSGHLFDELAHVTRIEATTRQDNLAMRAVLRRCGYVKEAHYRCGWPGADGIVHDAVGYSLLRSDWADGVVTPPDFDDEPGPAPPPGSALPVHPCLPRRRPAE